MVKNVKDQFPLSWVYKKRAPSGSYPEGALYIRF